MALSKVLLALIIFISNLNLINCSSAIPKENSHHTSCANLADGVHYIRPISLYNAEHDRLPSILVRCSSKWTILDYSLDPNIKSYFSSWSAITKDTASMDYSAEHKNWNHWFLMNDIDFSTSPDCQSCTEDVNTAYFMTGNYFGCSFATQLLCDMDRQTNECQQCSLPNAEDDELYNGICTHSVLSLSNPDIMNEGTTFKKCNLWNWNYLPSIGTNGQHCMCIKAKKSQNIGTVTALYPESEQFEESNSKKEEAADCSTIYKLTSNDFAEGTYRIQQCGTYRFMEDVELNMNAPTDEEMNSFDYSPNDVDKNYWMPSPNDDCYVSNNFIGPYSMGFFAGISVEANNVVIDLNGYEFKMNFMFFIQQRFFSLFELASKPFIDGQGPSNFGSNDEYFASSVIIKNGVLGLTSHHGIHGNNNKDVRIHDLQIKDFEISAITMNGFEKVYIENVDIGPNNQNVPVMPQYAHARFMLQRLETIQNKQDRFVFIGNQKYYAQQIMDDLQTEMDEAFSYIVNHENEPFNDNDIGNMFINKDGLPRSGTLYGIFLNSVGFNTNGLGQSPGISSDLLLRNVHIKDLRNNPMEMVHLKSQSGPFNDLVDIKNVVGADGKYVGTAYSNAQYALNKLVDNRAWSVLGHTFITDEMDQWISDKRNSIRLQPLKCNSDAMNHQVKGIMGIRIDNVQNVKVEGDVIIERLHNLGAFGDNVCGKYFNSLNGGNKYQQYPLQIGYTGNEVHGMSLIGSHGEIAKNANVTIDNLLSARGSVFGLQFYPNSNIAIGDNVNVNVNNIHSGAYLTGKELLQLKMQIIPNTVPRSCLFDIWQGDDLTKSAVFFGENVEIRSECVTLYSDCSFSLWRIDEENYGYDDVLNADYINDKDVDNTKCVFEDFDVLSSLSEYSEYDSQSLHLLKQQVLNKNIVDSRKKFIDFRFDGYILLILICCFAFIALIVRRLLCKSLDKSEALIISDNEISPLIVQ